MIPEAPLPDGPAARVALDRAHHWWTTLTPAQRLWVAATADRPTPGQRATHAGEAGILTSCPTCDGAGVTFRRATLPHPSRRHWTQDAAMADDDTDLPTDATAGHPFLGTGGVCEACGWARANPAHLEHPNAAGPHPDRHDTTAVIHLAHRDHPAH